MAEADAEALKLTGTSTERLSVWLNDPTVVARDLLSVAVAVTVCVGRTSSMGGGLGQYREKNVSGLRSNAQAVLYLLTSAPNSCEVGTRK